MFKTNGDLMSDVMVTVTPDNEAKVGPKMCPWCGSHELVEEDKDRRVFVEIGEYLADLDEENLVELGVDPETDELDKYEEEGDATRYSCRSCGQGFIAW